MYMKTVLITGANRGIGLEICKQLDKNNCQIILCSRDLKKGEKASENFSKNVIIRQLDVTSEKSVKELYFDINKQFGKLDVLINNAGLGTNAQESIITVKSKQFIKSNFRFIYRMIKKAQPQLKKSNFFNENIGVSSVSLSRVKYLMDTNLYGSWMMIQNFIPLLEKSNSAQIINVSSGMGALENMTGLYPGYSMSKASLNMLTLMFSKELETKNIKVNAVCPGWVKTEMGGPNAPKTVSEGADTIVWLALQNQEHKGKFFRDREIIKW